MEPFEKDNEEIKEVMKDRRMVRVVRSFMQKSREYREPHLEMAKDSRELYENWSSAGRSLTQRANLKLPFGFTIIETQVPQLMDIFFKGGSTIQYRGQDYLDAQWEALITDFHTQQLDEIGFQTKAAAFKKSMLLDGTGIAKIPYKYKEILTTKRESTVDELTGEIVRHKVPAIEVMWDGPDIEIVPIYDFFPDWSVKKPGDIESMRGCVHRVYRTLASLKASKQYKNLKELEMSVNAKGTSAWSTPYYIEDGYKQEFEKLQDNVEGIKDEGRIEVWEYWGLFDPTGDGNFKEYVITIGNGDVVLRAEENFYDFKFKPFVACPNYIRENEFYGIPELVAVRALIKEANTLRNARLDNINLSVNPMWLADRGAGINARSLFSRPNGIIWTNDINGIKPLTPQDPSLGSRDEMTFIQQDIQNATAMVNAAPIASSLGKQFGRSATGVNFIQSFSSSRIGLKARLLSDLFYKRIAQIMLMTNAQFVTEEKWVRVSDPNAPNPFEKLSPDAFAHNFDFAVETSMDNGGPEGQFQKMQTVSQLLQAIEQTQPGTIKSDVITEALLRPLLGRQVKRFVRSDDERMAMQNQKLAAEQAINASIGQGAPQPNAAGVQNVSPTQDVLASLGLKG